MASIQGIFPAPFQDSQKCLVFELISFSDYPQPERSQSGHVSEVLRDADWYSVHRERVPRVAASMDQQVATPAEESVPQDMRCLLIDLFESGEPGA